jgi:hypothetical protein
MKTGILTTQTIASDDIKDTKSIMGMSSKGMEMAQYFLRDKIYSNKVLAVVREYISNAYDEHVKYNIDKEVDINLYYDNSQWIWSVRDYAKGLNEHDIRNIFGVYFESTKSNENNSIGGFGIGGKAGFSYTDTFYVNSHHDGVKSCYVCTLGAGTKGIPVGEIYKISEEPTTEQGIEISLEVKQYDVNDFLNTTALLVSTFISDAKIKFHNKSNYSLSDYIPMVPEHVIEKGDYKFSTYIDSTGKLGNQKYNIRMGGIVYPHTYSLRRNRALSHSVIVDVPIGKLTIPISRESIESTPLNDKVFAEIEKYMDEIYEEELNELVVPKFGEVCSGNIACNNTYRGTFFVYPFSEVFNTTRKWYYHTSRLYKEYDGLYTGVVKPIGQSHAIYLLPNIKNVSNWKKRLISTLSDIYGDKYTGVIYMMKDKYETLLNELDDHIDISDCVFIDVKTLKLPKLPKLNIDKTSYQVFEKYGYKRSYTAEDLDALVTQKSFNGTEPEDDWYLETEDIEDLNKRTIGLVANHGTRCSFRTANSFKMVSALKELGWLTPECPEYIERCKVFNDKISRQRLIDRAQYELANVYFGAKCNPRILEHIKRFPEKITKLDVIKKNIIKESSTRGRILSTFREYSQNITREDLRKIMLMKD